MSLVAFEQCGTYPAYPTYPVYAEPRAATELTTRSELMLALCLPCALSAQLIIWPLLSSWPVEISQWKTWHQRRRPHVVISLEKDSCSLFKETFYFFGENCISYCITSDHELKCVPHSVETFMCKIMKETTSRCAYHWNLWVSITHIHLSLPF